MSQKEKEQLQAELSILKELKHPNIVQYFERDHLKNTLDLHLYMEYCGNGDLGQVIKGYKSRAERVPEDFVWSVFTQLVTALYRCHYGSDPPDAGRNVLGHFRNDTKAFITKKSTQYVIIHRDLKPENGMLKQLVLLFMHCSCSYVCSVSGFRQQCQAG
jgi:NIMA (never in mitosis gene a)-related kinase